MITKDDVLAASERIAPHVHRTPLVQSTRLGARAGGVRLHLKCECMQRTGSFKARGALNAMLQLSDGERARGVVTVSAGNHAQALAWAASKVGAACITVMPEGASRYKVEATRGYGGTVQIAPGERRNAFDLARQIAAEGRVLVHPFEDDRVAAGQGTVALEILDQLADVGVVIVPIGGGGLIAGMAMAIRSMRPDVRIIGVEPEGAPTMRRSLDAGAPQQIAATTVADGLAAPMVGEMTLDVVRRYVDDVILVTDDEIVAALRDILAFAKILVEPAGAASVATLTSGKLRLGTGTKVVAVLSGGNVDLDRLKSLL
jgi:threonine dehydratase